MMSDLYDEDIMHWSEHQAALLRRRAAGEIVNDKELDWPNIAEEIEDVGKSLLHSVQSHLVLAILRDLKAEAWPRSRDVSHWRAEARIHRRDARRRFSPSMRQYINIAELYADAMAGLPDDMDGLLPLPVPPDCPVTLDEILAPRPDEPAA
jgi:hypothetical protein